MSDYSNNEICKRLNAISRLRLVFGTYEELGKFTNFEVSGKNGLSRIGGSNTFLKTAAYDAICKYVEEDTGANFDAFITAYGRASEFFETYQLAGILSKKQHCFDLLDYVYGHLKPSEVANKSLRSLLPKIYEPRNDRQKVRASLLVLLGQDLLPLYHKGRGGSKDIAADLQAMIALAEEFVSRNRFYTQLPIIETWKRDFQEEEDTRRRYNIYFVFEEILANYSLISDPGQLYSRSRELRDSLLYFGDDTIWASDDKNELWEMVSKVNGQILRHFIIDRAAKTLTYEDIELVIYEDDFGPSAFAVHPDAAIMAVRGKQAPVDKLEEFSLDIEEVAPGKMSLTFTPITTSYWLKIHRITMLDETPEEAMAPFSDFTMVNKYPEDEYRYSVDIVAVTREDIFIDREEGGYYKLPRSVNAALDYVDVFDNIGILELTATGERFIAIADMNLYFNISTPDRLTKLGIEIVYEI